MTKTNLYLPRAVIFDWDNTLVDVWDVITDALNAVRTAFGEETVTVEEAKRLCTRALRDSFPVWYGQEWPKARKLFYSHYSEHHLAHVKIMPGAQELLVWLSRREIPLFVVSNKRGDNLRDEAAHIGWTETFSAIVGSMDAPHDKPARDPVDVALGKAGLKADDPAVWFVGDSSVDVECARNAGCTPVLVHNHGEARRFGVDLSFSGCHALLEMLYKIETGQNPPRNTTVAANS